MMRRRRALLVSLLTTGAAVFAAETQTPKNPFVPANSGATPAAAANEVIEFAGVSQMGKTTHLIIHDKTAKKNRWISVGETVEGISVLKYDPRLEQVVVKHNGTEKTLPLRKPTASAHTPAAVRPLPAPAGFNVPAPAVAQPVQILPAPAVAPAPAYDAAAQPQTMQPAPAKAPTPQTPEAQAQAKAETEARMLVSDLLEIGMAQRKAYEEAQRKAAEGKSGQPPVAEQPQPAQPQQPAPAPGR